MSDQPPLTFLDYLVQKNLIPRDRAEFIKKEAEARKISEDRIILEENLIKEFELAKEKSKFLNIPLKIIEEGEVIPESVLREVPEEAVKYYKFLPFEKAGKILKVGMLNPLDIKALDAVRFLSQRIGLKTQIYLISQSSFDVVLKQYESLKKIVTKALEELATEMEIEEDGVAKKTAEKSSISTEAPITKMVAVILRHAVEGHASDIHIEPLTDKVRVRYRVDGVLYTTLFVPKDIHAAIVSKIKILANLKIDESRIPQDGRFRMTLAGKPIDFRVSTLPTANGEKVEMRVLDPETGISTLENLGLEGRSLELVQKATKHPFGMILITGPTGSGKSTTLYALLNIINKEGVNIVTLEDPVEYYMEGINQSQIRSEIGYDFATGLRHILRQDPNVIMVGEIRDAETAGLAVHSALTGHLVFSTLHTNNAVGVIPRLIDMHIEPFLIPSSLILTVAQRLVKRLCPDCKAPVTASGRAEEIIEGILGTMPEEYREKYKKPYTIYNPVGCAKCIQMGTKGRVGIFEAIEMTPQLEKIILSGSLSEAELNKETKRQEMITLQQDGILKVLEGGVSLQDILEVTGEAEIEEEKKEEDVKKQDTRNKNQKLN